VRLFAADDDRRARASRKNGGLVRMTEVTESCAECRDDEHRQDNDAEAKVVPSFVSTVAFHGESPLEVDCTKKPGGARRDPGFLDGQVRSRTVRSARIRFHDREHVVTSCRIDAIVDSLES